jgi:hypothetical protein
MPTELAVNFRGEIERNRRILRGLPTEMRGDPAVRVNGWSFKQILGHLLDSAANNRQRFVRAAIDGEYRGPRYAQDAWVDLHGYQDQEWETLLRWWEAEHEILVEVVDRIPEERLDARCTVGDLAPVTLRFLIEDYLAHHRHHIEQLKPDFSRE